MATRTVKKKSPLLGGNQKIDNKMALAIIAAVLGVCAVIYYLASHAGKLGYTTLQNNANGVVKACQTSNKINVLAKPKVAGRLRVDLGGTTYTTVTAGRTYTPSYYINDNKFFWAGIFADGQAEGDGAGIEISSLRQCTAPPIQAQQQLGTEGLPAGTVVTFKASSALGDCGTAIKVRPSKICKSPEDIGSADNPITVTYPTSVKVAGKVYTAYQICGGRYDDDGGLGGCNSVDNGEPAPTGTMTVYAPKGGNNITYSTGIYYR